MKPIHRRAVLVITLLALAAATPARAETISLLCGGADRFDADLKRNTLIETNGDRPAVVYDHVKNTGDAFSGDIAFDGKKTSVVINRKSGQLKVTHSGSPAAEQRACTPYPKAAAAPTNKF